MLNDVSPWSQLAVFQKLLAGNKILPILLSVLPRKFMTYASQQLVDELQKAVASRVDKAQELKPEESLKDFIYEVSPDVADYLRRLHEYRERTKQVRVGEY